MHLNKIYVPYINTGNGYKYIITVYTKDSNEYLFSLEYRAPSMVIANNMFIRWRELFLQINDFKDDQNFIYEIYNISLGKRRIIK